MTEILGHDCDGRPLRAGDRVFLIGDAMQGAIKAGLKRHGSVIGPCPLNKHESCEVDIPHPGHWEYVSVLFNNLRRIDDRPEAGSWDEIEKITGWNPTKQPAEA